MTSRTAATMRPLTTGAGRKILVGVVDRDIPANASVVLVPVGDAYRLVSVIADGRGNSASLAAFLPAELVDQSEMIHAAEEATRR